MKFDPSVYLVVGRDFACGRELPELVAEAVAGGVTMVQLREKEAPHREFVEMARALKQTLAPLGIPLIINDSVEVARIVGADGIHLGQSDVPVAEARHILGANTWVGLSVETRQQAQQAELLDVDYLGVSPVFASASKTDTGTPWGLDGLTWLRKQTRHLLIGIGGITVGNASDVIRAGAHGVAVISAICSAASPRSAAACLSKIVRSAACKSDVTA